MTLFNAYEHRTKGRLVPGVVADPSELRELARAIHTGQEEIDKALQNMRGALKRTNWNDERRRQFDQEMERYLASVAAFTKQADEMRSYLAAKAKILDQFLAR